ncbi:MAG TPA: signal peptidase II [Rhodobacteraceae bacterium]|nr:signal peptidase II [Paracoccaceae bacterium]
MSSAGNQRHGTHWRLGLVLVLAAFALDRGFKYWMLSVIGFAPHSKVEVTGFFDLVMVWNRGISYGLFQQDSIWGQRVLLGLTLVIIAGVLYWLSRAGNRVLAAGLGLIGGGALSNAFDRFHYGAVADFFSFHAAGFYWYVFNLADVAIVAGVALLLYDTIMDGHKNAGKIN